MLLSLTVFAPFGDKEGDPTGWMIILSVLGAIGVVNIGIPMAVQQSIDGIDPQIKGIERVMRAIARSSVRIGLIIGAQILVTSIAMYLQHRYW